MMLLIYLGTGWFIRIAFVWCLTRRLNFCSRHFWLRSLTFWVLTLRAADADSCGALET